MEDLPLLAEVHLHCGARRRPRDEEGREGSALLGWRGVSMGIWEDSGFLGSFGDEKGGILGVGEWKGFAVLEAGIGWWVVSVWRG